MLVRVIVSGAIAWGLIATSTIAQTDSAAARVLKGKTAQGYVIKVAVRKQSFRLLRFEADLRCRDGSLLTLIESGFLWTRIRNSGHFRDAQFGKTDSVYFRGRMTKRRIRGRVRLIDKPRRGPRCQSRWISFRAGPR